MKKLLLASIGLSMLVLWAISCGGTPAPADLSRTPPPALSRSAR